MVTLEMEAEKNAKELEADLHRHHFFSRSKKHLILCSCFLWVVRWFCVLPLG